ncbi:hypothetical protein G4B88_002367 (mitochondrion) [Cannabis sativa]|uniref:Uncharacterized protein n=1 Tax=Cannabis sativa TaxID=3483 RepID=A0A7J6DV15_CANSA|nr:hypothetical protein G4B88_002367 [Cannabis sativa]
MKNEECPAPASTYSYQNEKRDFTKQARKALSMGLFNKARVGALTFFGFPKIEYFKVGKDPPLVSVRMSPRDPGTLASANTSASGRSNGARLVSARREMKNITNTGNKGIPDHICFCAMTISLELRGPTHISTVYRGPRPEPHVQVSLHVARPCFPRRCL